MNELNTTELSTTELDLLSRAVEALKGPMPAADQALADEAVRLYALGKTL